METKRITLQQEDKTPTTVFASLSDISTPMGSFLLLHDMAEHHGRFDDFCRVLNGKGYDTYTYDHRGHGSEIRFEDLGFISEEDGYELLINDALHILKYVKKINRGRKLILMGVGMGSLIARCLIQMFDALNACILVSSPNPSHKKINSLMTSARFIKFSKKPRYISTYLTKKLTEFKGFSRISNRTSFDWVSRDNQMVGSYISDPLCGFPCTVSFYYDMLKLTDEAIAKTNLKQIRKDLPILLLGGSHDPVCDYGEDIADLFDTYQRYHLTDVDCTIYEGCRHDLLHESNNAEIIKDILEWLNRALDNRRLREAAARRAKQKKNKGQSKNRTAAEAARSAMGYASDTDLSDNSILADNVGDDDEFLEDMGYFNRHNPDTSGLKDDEEFIILDDEEDEDFMVLEEPEKPEGKTKPGRKSSKKNKAEKETKETTEDTKPEEIPVQQTQEDSASKVTEFKTGKKNASKKKNEKQKNK